MIWMLSKLAIRLVVFGAVFGFAAWKNEKVTIKPKYAVPLVALVFGLLNVGLYWLAKPVFNLATFGTLWIALPFFLNGLFLYATNRLLKHLEIKGMLTMLWLAGLLTVAHGALYLGLDVIPAS
jgi:hypothetical protein